jgi:hypothetical protein
METDELALWVALIGAGLLAGMIAEPAIAQDKKGATPAAGKKRSSTGGPPSQRVERAPVG